MNLVIKGQAALVTIEFLRTLGMLKCYYSFPNIPLLLSHFSHVWLLCDPRHCSPPGSSVHRILQARILEWVAISFSPQHIILLKNYLFSIGGSSLYNIALVSDIHQHESDTGIHMSPPSWISLPPPTSHPIPTLFVVTERQVWAPWS